MWQGNCMAFVNARVCFILWYVEEYCNLISSFWFTFEICWAATLRLRDTQMDNCFFSFNSYDNSAMQLCGLSHEISSGISKSISFISHKIPVSILYLHNCFICLLIQLFTFFIYSYSKIISKWIQILKYQKKMWGIQRVFGKNWQINIRYLPATQFPILYQNCLFLRCLRYVLSESEFTLNCRKEFNSFRKWEHQPCLNNHCSLVAQGIRWNKREKMSTGRGIIILERIFLEQVCLDSLIANWTG